MLINTIRHEQRIPLTLAIRVHINNACMIDQRRDPPFIYRLDDGGEKATDKIHVCISHSPIFAQLLRHEYAASLILSNPRRYRYFTQILFQVRFSSSGGHDPQWLMQKIFISWIQTPEAMYKAMYIHTCINHMKNMNTGKLGTKRMEQYPAGSELGETGKCTTSQWKW